MSNELIDAGALRQFKHNDGSEGLVFAYDKAAADRELALLKREIAELEQDAARYRWLMANAVDMAPESRDGPPHPVLEMYADIFNECPHQTPQFRITRKIDLEIKEGK